MTGKCFVSVGSFTPNKNMENMLLGFSIAIKKHPDINLIIFGDGPLRGNLEEIVSKNGLSNVVEFKGIVSRKELANSYKKADYFILVSRFETFGVSYIEAMAAGLPVIAGNSGGPSDFIDESNGVIADVDDPDSIADLICLLYEKGDSFNRAKISFDIVDRFNSKIIAEQLMDVYKSVLEKQLTESDHENTHS